MHYLSVAEENAKVIKSVVRTKFARTTNADQHVQTNVVWTPFAMPKTTWPLARVLQATLAMPLPDVTRTRPVLVEVEFTITTARNEKYQRDSNMPGLLLDLERISSQ